MGETRLAHADAGASQTPATISRKFALTASASMFKMRALLAQQAGIPGA
jgi:hypothetical protein